MRSGMRMGAILKRFLLLGCLTGLATTPGTASAQWSGKPSPHDGQHLVVIRPTEWLSTAAHKSVATPLPACAFGAEAAIKEGIESPLTVRHAGDYSIWIHLSGPEKAPVALRYEVLRDGKPVAQGDLVGTTA